MHEVSEQDQGGQHAREVLLAMAVGVLAVVSPGS